MKFLVKYKEEHHSGSIYAEFPFSDKSLKQAKKNIEIWRKVNEYLRGKKFTILSIDKLDNKRKKD